MPGPQKTVDKRITPAFRAQAGKGRPKGTPNKLTAEVKDMIAQALANAGGVKYLEQQAKDNPKAFLSLVGRVIPLQLTASHTHEHVDREAAHAEVDELFGPPQLVVNNG